MSESSEIGFDRGTLVAHERAYRRHRDRALERFRADRPVAAAAHAQIAACHAFFHHPGLWASPQLERMLWAVGCRLDVARAEVRPRSRPVDRVLHVMTRVAAIGGHSRMAWRWIDVDRGRSHSVVLTRQGALPVPDELVSAAERSGGTVRILNRERGDVLSWAGRLRMLARDHDLVVLHIFAEDVIPPIAFAERDGLPPIVFIDQADHAFSLGASTADLYVALRRTGAELAVARRGVDPERVAELPITISDIERRRSRVEAKRALGYDDDDVLLLSIARAPKFRPFGDQHFLDAVVPVLERHRNAQLLVVGPGEDASWTAAAAATGGRIRVLAERSDTEAFYEASDVYIDAFPVISNTSLLEAGCYGIPLVSRCLHPDPHTIFCSGAPGLEPVIVRGGRQEVVDALSELVSDPERRRELGELTRESIRARHVGRGWRASLEELYLRATSVGPLTEPPPDDDVVVHETSDVLWPELFGSDVPTSEVESWFVKGLPTLERLRAVARIARDQRRPRPQLLVPEWVTGAIRARWRSRS